MITFFYNCQILTEYTQDLASIRYYKTSWYKVKAQVTINNNNNNRVVIYTDNLTTPNRKQKKNARIPPYLGKRASQQRKPEGE